MMYPKMMCIRISAFTVNLLRCDQSHSLETLLSVVSHTSFAMNANRIPVAVASKNVAT